MNSFKKIIPSKTKKKTPMTFQQAREKLTKIADGKYHTIAYSESIYEKNNYKTQECSLYISEYPHFIGPTWEDAFEALNNKLYPIATIIDETKAMSEI